MVTDRAEKIAKEAESEGTVDLLAVLRRRMGLIFCSTLLGLSAGAAYFVFSTPTFESKAQVLLMQNDSAAIVSQNGTGEMSVSEELLATHMNLVQSRRLLRAAAARPAILQSFEDVVLESREEALVEEAVANEETVGEEEAVAKEEADVDTAREQVKTIEELPGIESATADSSVVDYLAQNLYVTRGGEGSARDAHTLSIGFRHTDKEESQLVVSALLLEYQLFVNDKFKDLNEEAVFLIGEAREKIAGEIGKANKAYADFRKEAEFLSSGEGGANIFVLRYEELASEIAQLDTKIEEAKSRIQLVAEGLDRLEGSDGPELRKLALIDEQNANRLGVLVAVERGEAQTAAFQAAQPERAAGAQVEYNSLLALKTQLSQAVQEYGPRHPEVQNLESQVSEMEGFFRSRQLILGDVEDKAPLTPDDVMVAYQAILDNDLAALEVKRSDLIKQMEAAKGKAQDLVKDEIKEEQLIRAMTRQEELYSSVVERLRDLNMQESSTLIQEVIAEPELGKQVSPNKLTAAVIAMITSVFLAGAAVLAAELSDRSVHSSSDLEKIFDSPVLSHVPDFYKDAETHLLIRKIKRTSPPFSHELIVHHDAQSRISEIYRTIRTQLLINLDKQKNVIAFTSPTQSDGKSTNIANLAVSLANAGKSVLLVDADMRRPTIHSLFGVETEIGLSSVLRGEQELVDATAVGVIDCLDVMPCGPKPENPAELLSSDSFGHFVTAMKEKYDLVLIDCPPTLPVADPCIVSAHADSMLIVTTLSPDSFTKSKRCQSLLQSADANIGGIIVNRAGKANGYYSYNDYSDSYGSYRSETVEKAR